MDNLFASKPGIRLRCEIGTFDCEYAYTQVMYANNNSCFSWICYNV